MAKLSSPMLMLLAACSLLLGGCVQGTHVDASPVAVQVIDRTTRRPIVGATVVLGVTSPDHEAQTRTDQDGRFRLAGFRHVEPTPLPYGFFRAPTGRLQVEAAGYRTYDCGEFYDRYMARSSQRRRVLTSENWDGIMLVNRRGRSRLTAAKLAIETVERGRKHGTGPTASLC